MITGDLNAEILGAKIDSKKLIFINEVIIYKLQKVM